MSSVQQRVSAKRQLDSTREETLREKGGKEGERGMKEGKAGGRELRVKREGERLGNAGL